ncbi:MAG: hypothetical protein NZM04_07355 [Methylacidiphilales bacterium]|nr:hypothetical protein [Candidatus Methylacidiphilales bacterium]MDW8349219.1 hypothetical protein [Verrucomicrobiae bacterium]
MNRPLFRLIIEEERPKGWNMAADQALLECSPHPVLRVYSWSPDSQGRRPISIGYQDPWQIVPHHRSYVRRLTGGGLVDHENDFTYSVIIPQRHLESLQISVAESYRSFHQILSDALAEIKIHTILNTSHPTSTSAIPLPCFISPVPHDLLHPSTRQKIAGAAQRRNRFGLLHQGSVQGLNWSLDLKKTFALTLIHHFCKKWDAHFIQETITSEELSHTEKLCRERYDTVAWNQRI